MQTQTKKQLRADFQRFLEHGGYATPPGRTACALASARILARWRTMEAAGLVRITAIPDDEPYDAGDMLDGYTNIYGRRVSAEEARKEVNDMIERDGVWCVSTAWSDGQTWHVADSICGCAGYRDVCDPFENDYVIDLMDSALDAREAFVEDMAAAI